jgi:hypothetical protein
MQSNSKSTSKMKNITERTLSKVSIKTFRRFSINCRIQLSIGSSFGRQIIMFMDLAPRMILIIRCRIGNILKPK